MEPETLPKRGKWESKRKEKEKEKAKHENSSSGGDKEVGKKKKKKSVGREKKGQEMVTRRMIRMRMIWMIWMIWMIRMMRMIRMVRNRQENGGEKKVRKTRVEFDNDECKEGGGG